MRSVFPFIFVVVTCAYSQTTPPVSARSGATLVENTPETVIAVVNGRKFTVGDLSKLLPSLPPTLQQLVVNKPKEALEQYALGEVLSLEAEKLRLDQREPYRQQIENARRQVMVQALMKEKADQARVSAEDVRKYYHENPEGFRQASVRMIFVSRTLMAQNVQEESPEKLRAANDLKARAETVAKLAREGQDFGELAKKFSDDATTADKGGVLPAPVRANQQNVPAPIRDALLKAEPGSIVGPLEHATGWYVFRIENQNVAEFDAVRPEIEKYLKDTSVKHWMDEMNKKSTVAMENPAFWTTFREANKQGAAQ